MDDLARIMAERDCERLQVDYALAADRGDADAFAALFSEDATIVIPEHPPFAGRAAIHASLVALAALGVTMRHIITNQHVRLTGPDSAEGGCYLTVFDSPEPADAAGLRASHLPSTVGDYADRFVRTAGGWRFHERRLTRVFSVRAAGSAATTGATDGDR